MEAGIVAGAVAAAVLAAGSGAAAGGTEGGGTVGGATVDLGGYGVRGAARFSPPNAFVASPALTYDMELVPAGARIEVVQRAGHGRVSVRVERLAAGRAYGAHAHQGECGGDPAAAGGHYQRREDPVQPSTDPACANPENEVWLGFTTDAHGAGAATARQGWEFRPGEARSVVLHGMPGGAGARIACFTVPFEPTAVEPTAVEPTAVEPAAVEPAAVEAMPVEPVTVAATQVERVPFERVPVEPVPFESPVHRGR
ncbi:superoxide dismutase family protein [Streptomyces sp. AcE210]|uniref:superoxide dismutase family protein n=1 Tax=Streptomyces sp. AcE210 TaxID=2292703 RepID=UPI0026BACC4E